jgi:hypothetical protein
MVVQPISVSVFVRGGFTMHTRLMSLTLLTLAVSTIPFAVARNGNKNEGNFTIQDKVRIGSTELRPGDYKAEWTDAGGGAVKVTILQHGKTVATTEGTLKDLQEPAAYDSVIVIPSGDNAKIISEIEFSKRKQALVLGS